MMRIELIVDAPNGSLRRVSASLARPLWIGRDPSADVVLDSEHVSRRHACIEADGELLLLRDRSVNGTALEGVRVHARNAELRLPAKLGIGPFAVHVRLEPAAEPALERVLPQPSARGETVPLELRRRLQRALIEHLDLTRFDPSRAARNELRPKVIAALEQICDGLGDAVPKGTRASLIRELCEEAVDFGPLTPLLDDPEVSEIMVVDPATIYVERAGVIEESTARFTDDEAARSVIERIVTPLGRRIDESTPVVDARLPDGSRVHAVIAPLASRGTCITVRKFPQSRPRLCDLVAWSSLSSEMANLLERSVRLRKSIVISGGTGSGKTTLLNVLSAAIPEQERIVTIEDAAELRLQQKHVVALEARLPNLEGKGAFPIRELVKNALRMRPDRIVVGECRGGEALDMLQAMNTGHEGSMTTTHANSPREACARLETLCLMSGLSLPLEAIRRQIASSVHLIVQQARFADGARRVTSITELIGLTEQGEIALCELFRFERDPALSEGGLFAPTGCLPTFASELRQLSAGDASEAAVASEASTHGGVP